MVQKLWISTVEKTAMASTKGNKKAVVSATGISKDRVRQDPLRFYILVRIIQIRACGFGSVDLDILKESLYSLLNTNSKYQGTKFSDERALVNYHARAKVKNLLKYMNEPTDLFFSENVMEKLLNAANISWEGAIDNIKLHRLKYTWPPETYNHLTKWQQFCSIFEETTIDIYNEFEGQKISEIDQNILLQIKQRASKRAEHFMRMMIWDDEIIIEDENFMVRPINEDQANYLAAMSEDKDMVDSIARLCLVCYDRFNQICGKVIIIPVRPRFIRELINCDKVDFGITTDDLYVDDCNNYLIIELKFSSKTAYMMEQAIFRSIRDFDVLNEKTKLWMVQSGKGYKPAFARKYSFRKVKTLRFFNDEMLDLLYVKVSPTFLELCRLFNGANVEDNETVVLENTFDFNA